MAAWMASAEDAKAAAVVPARQASNGAVLGGDGGGLPQIRASWPDLEGGRRWWSATAADLRRLATAVGDGGNGGGHGSWRRQGRLPMLTEDSAATRRRTATAKRPLAVAAVRGGGG
uniref:DUF834 domain-containing protein n=1 Tax=Oryza nivara TaxID=4536 RepID=A0A0E0IT49_ORYNI